MAHENKAKKAKVCAAEVITLHLIVRAQARNRPVGITGETISQSERASYRLQTQAI